MRIRIEVSVVKPMMGSMKMGTRVNSIQIEHFKGSVQCVVQKINLSLIILNKSKTKIGEQYIWGKIIEFSQLVFLL